MLKDRYTAMGAAARSWVRADLITVRSGVGADCGRSGEHPIDVVIAQPHAGSVHAVGTLCTAPMTGRFLTFRDRRA